MKENFIKIIKELRADLFYQISSKIGAEKACGYPSIKDADILLDSVENDSSLPIDELQLMYQNRLEAIKTLIGDGKGKSMTMSRLKAKRSCYSTTLRELNMIKNGVW